MEDPQCKDCCHFRQHYVHFCEKRYDRVPCGHCTFPRLKHRRPDTVACVYFSPLPQPAAEEPTSKT